MIELTEKAAQYAAEKSNEVIANALAKAYEEGYRDGYKDREEEIPIDLRDNKTEYVDLGLPSGTLWSADYEMEDKKVIFLPYETAENYNLPTEEQWKELFETCERHVEKNTYGDLYSVTFIGPNGNSINFHSTGFKKAGRLVHKNMYGAGHLYFWINNKEDGNEKKAVHMGRVGEGALRITAIDITLVFSGFSIPIRLVKTRRYILIPNQS